MKKSLALALALSLSASLAHAGGPVVIVDDGGPAVAGSPRSGGALPLLLGALVVAAVVGGSGT